jgi:hypothetical protein
MSGPGQDLVGGSGTAVAVESVASDQTDTHPQRSYRYHAFQFGTVDSLWHEPNLIVMTSGTRMMRADKEARV